MSLRLKLLLAASLLLTVPVAGYRFVLAMEAFLRANQLEAAADTARTLAGAVQARGPLSLPSNAAPTGGDAELNVHPLAAAPQVDGYLADWAELAPAATADRVTLRAGSHGDDVHLLLRLPRAGGARRAAALRLVFEDAPLLRRAWLLDLTSPGAVPVFEVPPAAGVTGPAHVDTRFEAAVGHERDATVVELRLPAALRAPRLHFEPLGPGADAVERVPAAGAWQLRMPPAGLQETLDRFDTVPGRRLRVTDRHGRVVAESGALDGGAGRGRFAVLMERLLEPDEDALLSLAPDTLTLEGPEMTAALGGTPGARLRRDPARDAIVVAATQPLGPPGAVAGVLVVEESTSGIQALARRALLELLVTAGIAMLAGTALLLFVAGRTAARLAELRDQARRAVDPHGRVREPFHAPAARDEIGDLGRSFESAVSRLKGYQDYLEQLARRLSHELRTPITVIRSSLENMALDIAPEDPLARSADRARQGVDRLDALIRRMSEATRLEHAMSDTERVTLDLCALAESAVAAQAATWEHATLTATCGSRPVSVTGSPDLLLQALDKLIANARDFAAPESTVTVRVENRDGDVDLCVENAGPGLPPGSAERLFDSMVSEREGRADAQPHLGLGLYIVRLVARFHGGREYAGNRLTDGRVTGVRIGMRLPPAAPPH